MLLFVSWAIVGFAALGLISGEIYTFLFGPDSEMWPIHIFTSIIGGFAGFYVFMGRWDKKAKELRELKYEGFDTLEDFRVRHKQISENFVKETTSNIDRYTALENQRMQDLIISFNDINSLVSQRIAVHFGNYTAHDIQVTNEHLSEIENKLSQIFSAQELINKKAIKILKDIDKKGRVSLNQSYSISSGILSEVKRLADEPLI